MEKLQLHTNDLTDENIEKIGTLFPSCITEKEDDNGKLVKAIDFDVLKDCLSKTPIASDDDSRYTMLWPGKRAARQLAFKSTTNTLRPCPEESVNFENTKNLYIEGDNLEVLKLLRETYLGKVKMIYIDPPYNTGNDFIYDDDFKQDEDEYVKLTSQIDEEGKRLVKILNTCGRFHSNWLNMIYPRLLVVRDLLSDDGIIFISIDDNEMNNLKKICDEIFGENNFRSIITVMANPGGRDYGGIAKTTEYLLVYTKTPNTLVNKVPDESHVFEFHDDLGPFELRELRNRNTIFNDKNRPNLCYPFYLDPKDKDEHGLYHISLEQDNRHTIKVMPLVSNGIQTVWRWGKEERSRKNLNINIKGKLKQDGSYMIVEKYRDENVMIKNTWIDKKFRTENGSIQVRNIFNEKGVFSYPKPIEIPLLAAMTATNKDSIVLDFFSGSATTAHAIMELNARDNGSRKFIMVQLAEQCDNESEAYKSGYKNICEIGKERIRRAGKKIQEEHPNAKIDTGFRVLKVDSSNTKDIYYKPEETQQRDIEGYIDNLKEDRSSFDLLFQVMLELGIPLDVSIKSTTMNGLTVYTVAGNSLIACFDKGVNEDLIKEMAKQMPLYAAFRDVAYTDDSTKINVEQIFKQLSKDTKIFAI